MFEVYGNAVVRRLVVVAFAVVAGVTAACARSGDSSSPLAPSGVAPSELSTSAKGGNGGGGTGTNSSPSTLTLVLYTDVALNGVVNHGDTITFNVSTTATTQPQVKVQCSESGVVVYNAATAFYDGFPWPGTQYMTMESAAWTSGAADCTATLYYTSGKKATNTTLATLDFHVEP